MESGSGLRVWGVPSLGSYVVCVCGGGRRLIREVDQTRGLKRVIPGCNLDPGGPMGPRLGSGRVLKWIWLAGVRWYPG